MKPSEKLVLLGFKNIVNNMGTIIWERRTTEQYVDVLEFSSHGILNYTAFVRSGQFAIKRLLVSKELHDVIDEYIRKELWW